MKQQISGSFVPIQFEHSTAKLSLNSEFKRQNQILVFVNYDSSFQHAQSVCSYFFNQTLISLLLNSLRDTLTEVSIMFVSIACSQDGYLIILIYIKTQQYDEINRKKKARQFDKIICRIKSVTLLTVWRLAYFNKYSTLLTIINGRQTPFSVYQLLLSVMSDLKSHDQNKKWSETFNISFKMLKYANDEFADGNLLNSKSILESLERSIKQNFKDIPQIYNDDLKTLNENVEKLISQFQLRRSSKKQSKTQFQSLER